MKRPLGAAMLLALTACSTAQIQSACGDAQEVVKLAQPFLAVAPASVQAAATAIGVGTVVCGSPEYAVAREMVISFLKTKGVVR